ncbi:MAG: cupredoxin domain-containing protein [Xanthomonadaceae bacterium]|nr:cupredoxin domain-containing protein [Xanthomonadaceae bacterium]MDE2278143.1 cupredoxin domain-containing protein [Xanthomonadaceae bacterium]MDE2316519.1 cupredoxin domain-containing protein [Xanthomonadaceae bacterium]
MKPLLLLALGLGLAPLGATAATLPEYTLVIRGHAYQPATLQVPANTKFKLHVRNEDAVPSEFESNDFNREQIVLPGSIATVYIGPLDKGRYTFFDDFHRDSGRGVLIAQ